MTTPLKIFLYLIITSFFIINCSSDNDDFIDEEPEDSIEISPVVFDINAVPYPKLSDYNFFKSPIEDLDPVYGVLPFQPVSQLFTDYALKKRFIWMPEGASATYQDDNKILNFPVGTILIKNFYYENVVPDLSKKIIETRLMIRMQNEWIFANYIWNEEQNEALYNMDGGFVPIQWVQNGENKETNYEIPNINNCTICHYSEDNGIEGSSNVPIGPKPQNLNFEITFGNESKNQLEKLKEFGYLIDEIPSNISSIIDYNDTSKSLDLRARSYLEINCGHCHSNGGYAQFYPVRFNFSELPNYNDLGFCVEPNINHGLIPNEAEHIVYPGDAFKSVIYYRINSTHPSIKMPMIGTTLIHNEGVQLISNWINSFEEGCE